MSETCVTSPLHLDWHCPQCCDESRARVGGGVDVENELNVGRRIRRVGGVGGVGGGGGGVATGRREKIEGVGADWITITREIWDNAKGGVGLARKSSI